jgi:hypothetical protein
LRDGAGRPVRVGYVLTDPNTQVVGTQVAADPAKGMALYRVNGLLRTSTSVSGWYDDTWTGPTVVWTRHGCTAGLLRIPVHTNPELFAGAVQHIRVTGSTTTPFTVDLAPTATRTIVVQLRPRAGLCRVRFDIAPTRRAAGDPRTLGVLISGFAYVPAPGA